MHAELHTQDLKKAKKFCGTLCEWTLEGFSEMNYTVRPDRRSLRLVADRHGVIR